MIITTDNLYIRQAPSTDAKVSGVIFANTRLSAISKTLGQNHRGKAWWYKLDEAAYLWGGKIKEESAVWGDDKAITYKQPAHWNIAKENVAIRIAGLGDSNPIVGYIIKGGIVKEGRIISQVINREHINQHIIFDHTSQASPLWINDSFLQKDPKTKNYRYTHLQPLKADQYAELRRTRHPVDKNILDQRAETLQNPLIQAMGFSRFWEEIGTGKKVRVGVVNGGFARQPNIDSGVYFDVTNENLSKDNWETTFASIKSPSYFHGTHCVEIISGKNNNSGLAFDAEIIMIKAASGRNGFGGEYFSRILSFCKEARIDILSISHDLPLDRKAYLDKLIASNVLVVISAGNEKKELPIFNYKPPNLLLVGGYDRKEQKTPFHESIMYAPSIKIIKDKDVKDNAISSSSYAAPVVASIAALIKSAFTNIHAQQIGSIIEDSLIKTALPSYTTRFISLDAILEKINEISNKQSIT